jgi:mannose-6-phosphate isomerase class I
MRKLPKDFINCAWGFEAVTPDMSVLISIGQKTLEIPFITFLSKERKQLMGTKASKKFGWFFPIRIHYDDSYDGGNMAIQVHPNGSYVKKHFNESVGQHEAYYIVKTKLGSKVYLGLKENISLKDLFEAAKRAKYEKKPLDYENYVNSIPSAPGDLFLIPAGTIHALGKDQVCLEIGTSYGYTFHVYDYLRPNLKGNLREIHLDHSLGALKDYRRTNWVRNNLKQPPKILRSFESGTEYLLGWLRGVPFEVHRIEFTRKAEDDTSGRFHILTLIKGKDIEIRSVEDPSKSKKIHFSETVIVPAAFGRYGIVGDGQCVILKVLLRE